MAPGSKSEFDDKKADGNAVAEKYEEDLETLFEYIDEKHGFLINRLRDFVEFRTVSSDPLRKDEFPRMAEFVVRVLWKFGIRSTVMNMIETEENDARAEGDVVPLILAETEIDPTKRTVLFYCHYDVHPINYYECWVDPFELTMTHDDSELHGKGTSAGKGPLLGVINAIGAYQKMKMPLPVNVKIILDPMGTVDTDATGKFLKRVDTDFFFNIDSVCLCVGSWLGSTRPCVSHGSRGLCYFTVEVEGPSKDLHSGTYGGLLNEPMADLVFVLNSLVDKNGVIRVTDIYEDVPPVSKEQRKFYKSIHFSVRDFQQEIGATELQVNEDKAAILMRLWCQPSLTIHGIEGAFSEPGTRNVIPCKVKGKFSINIVPNMKPSKVKKKVVDYLAKVWKARKSMNKIRVQMTVGKMFWFTDPSDMNVVAAKNAVAKVYCNEPDLIRQPNRIRIANVLRKLTEAPVVMMPIGKSNDISDTDSEKIDVINYMNGCKMFAAYMKYLAELFPSVKAPQETRCTCKITGQLDSCKCYMQYIPPNPEEEMDNLLSRDWTLSEISPGMSGDEKPAFRYYYLSLIAMKRMQKLQEVISISHFAPIWSGSAEPVLPQKRETFEEVTSSLRMSSRLALASFSVANLQDESKPRTGGWLPKPTTMLGTPTADVVSASVRPPPESSTRVIPREKEPSRSTVALQPTVFSFRLAQTLKRDKSDPLHSPKHQVLKNIRSYSVVPNANVREEGASESLVRIPSTDQSKPAEVEPINRQTLEASSNSTPDLLARSMTKSRMLRGSPSAITVNSEVLHPNVKRSVNPSDVISSTSRILYDKRLKKPITESTESLKSASFVMESSKKITVLTDVVSPAETVTVDSSATTLKPEIGTPGSPIKPYAVVSSMSKILYEKRMTKEVTDSMKGLMSGHQMGSERSSSPTSNPPGSDRSVPGSAALGPSVSGSVARVPMNFSAVNSAESSIAASSLASSPTASL